MSNTPHTPTEYLSHDEMLAIAPGDMIAIGHNREWLPVFKVEVHAMEGDREARSIVYVSAGRPGSYDIQRAFPTNPKLGGGLTRARYRKAQPVPVEEVRFARPLAGDTLDKMLAYAERVGGLSYHVEMLIQAIDRIGDNDPTGLDLAKRDAVRARAMLDALTREADEARAQRILADLPDRSQA